MTTSPSPLARQHFLLRRLHSLTGIVPIGVFLIAHLTTNSALVWGGISHHAKGDTLSDKGVYYFQDEVAWINEEVPHLILIEITLWVSIAFHAILGLYYTSSGKANNASYRYAGNWRYTLQRWSGIVGILFIFYHVATLRWGWSWLVPGGAKWDYHFAASTLAEALRGSSENFTTGGLLISAFYFIGVSLLVFHFANGLWTAALTWGVVQSAAAQRRWGYVCAGLGVGLMGMAWAALFATLTLDIQRAQQIEQDMKDASEQTASVVTPPPESADGY